MSANFKNFIITFLTSVVIGCSATYLIASSENGYVAGFIVLPLFLLFGVASLILLISGFVCLGLKKKFALWLLLSAVLLPASFISSALIAKHFEVGAYRQEPMISIDERVNNIVIFKAGTTNDQINDFWNRTMLIERADGRGYDPLPGLGTMMKIQSRNEREAMAFGFFPNTTEEQKQFVFAKVKSSPIVHQLLENQLIKEYNANSENSSSVANSNKPAKKVIITDSTNSK
jgi:hypothetical protein